MSTPRQQILDEVRVRPGIHKSEVARLLGMGRGTMLHHVRRLVQDGTLVAIREGWKTRLYRVHPDLLGWLGHLEQPPEAKEALKASPTGNERNWSVQLRRGEQVRGNAIRERIVLLVQSRLCVSRTDLCRQLNLGRSTVAYHLKLLNRHLVVHAYRWGQEVYVLPGNIGLDERRWLCVLMDVGRHRLMKAILEEQQASAVALARRTGDSPRRVQRDLSHLMQAGLVMRRRHGTYELSAQPERVATLLSGLDVRLPGSVDQ